MPDHYVQRPLIDTVNEWSDLWDRSVAAGLATPDNVPSYLAGWLDWLATRTAAATLTACGSSEGPDL